MAMSNKRPNPLFKFRGKLSYSECQRYLIGAIAGSTRFFDPRNFNEVACFPKAKGVIGAVFLPGGRDVALAEYMHSVGVYRINDGAPVGRKWKIVEEPLDVTAFLPAPGSDEIIHASWEGPPRVLDYEGNILRTIGGRTGGPSTKAVAFSPNGELLAVVTDSAVWVYDWPAESLRTRVDVFSDMQRNTGDARHARIAFFTDSQVVVGNNEGAVRLFDLAANETEVDFCFETPRSYCREFAIHDDLGVIAFQDGGKLQFYDLGLLRGLGSVTLHKTFATIYGFSPQHETLAAGVGETGCVFNTKEMLDCLER